jgi:polyhydroxyalkanoate synthesis regulator phasin
MAEAGKKSSGRKSSAKKSGAKKSSAKKSGAKKGAGKKASAKKGGAKKSAAKKAATSSRRSQSSEFSGKSVAEFRRALSTNLIRPLDLVMISRERIEGALDEVVKRGRMTRDDATQLGQALFTVGRQQTDDVMKDLEQLLGRGRTRIESRTETVRDRSVEAARGARNRAGSATAAARKAADPLLAQADRARRAAGVGPSFPITGYDDLTSAQISARLAGLTPAELRKVRDYERRRGNRKSVLEAVEAALR